MSPIKLGEVRVREKIMYVGDVLELSSSVNLQLGGGLVRRSTTMHTISIQEVRTKAGIPSVVIKVLHGNLRHELYQDGALVTAVPG